MDQKKKEEVEIKMSYLEYGDPSSTLNQSKLSEKKDGGKYRIDESMYRQGDDFIIDLRGNQVQNSHDRTLKHL